MRKIWAVALAAAISIGIISAAQAGGTVKLYTDPAGDAGATGRPVPGADQGGFDLTGGTIKRVGKNLEFTTTVASMPDSGALPEGFRFLQHFKVGTHEYRLMVKSADIGKPDVVGQSGTERVGRVDMAGHFRLESCTDQVLTPDGSPTSFTLINCSAIAYVKGQFNVAKKQFTAIVPMKAIKVKAGSLIAPSTAGAASTGCQICWLPHYAERSLTPHTVIDAATSTKTYKVPR
jgi:hypothetical protein